MANNFALVIVDMQPQFQAANNPSTVQGVCRAVRQAKQSGQTIVVLEFGGYGNTHIDILDEIGDYDKVKWKTKYKDDGSLEVINAFEFDGRPLPDEFHVCGVNLSCCVEETIDGLLYRCNKPVKMLVDAVNQPSYWASRESTILRISFKVSLIISYDLTEIDYETAIDNGYCDDGEYDDD
jgi:nicotinamidase-related amidase